MEKRRGNGREVRKIWKISEGQIKKVDEGGKGKDGKRGEGKVE